MTFFPQRDPNTCIISSYTFFWTTGLLIAHVQQCCGHLIPTVSVVSLYIRTPGWTTPPPPALPNKVWVLFRLCSVGFCHLQYSIEGFVRRKSQTRERECILQSCHKFVCLPIDVRDFGSKWINFSWVTFGSHDRDCDHMMWLPHVVTFSDVISMLLSRQCTT